MDQEYQYDLFVIGGGSGGLSCARTASSLGARVALADFVKPSPIGTKWGLGGTCVNVGCIPKKLMHYCGLLGENMKDLEGTGWEIQGKINHKWEKMIETVQMHIKKLNFGYRTGLKKEKIVYLNKLASFVDEHTIELLDAKNEKERVTAKYIVIAVGGRPNIPENLEKYKSLVITSDDIFSLEKPPGKTLVVGASYIALECAGFLTALGYPTTVMVRSILLRGFDQDIASKLKSYMQSQGTEFINSIPHSIEKTPTNQKKVLYEGSSKTPESAIFDTILLAVGRSPDFNLLNLKSLGFSQDKNTNKLIVNEADCTSISNIFCIGDCAFQRPELTPSAIMAGRLLARRLFAGSKTLMDYQDIATTVFTPLEYACVGLSEEKAEEKLGKGEFSVYHTYFKPLEWSFSSEKGDQCYVKVIVNKKDQKVMGVHYLGPNAGEVIQGYAVAVKMGVSKKDLDRTVGIHPTCAEELVDLKETKEENANAKKSGC